MKKILAAILILVMLVPMGSVVYAEESADKPFYLVQWSPFASDLTNVYHMPFVWANSGLLDTPLACVSYGGEYNIGVNAAHLKEKFDTYPDGSRYFNFCLVPTAFKHTQVDAVFVESGIAIVQEWLHAFLEEYSRIGGKLDGLVIDMEFEDQYATYLYSRHYTNDPLIYHKIVSNPVYQEKIRPQLEERGFKFYPNPSEYTPEIFGIHPSTGSVYAQSRSIWDTVMRSYINQSITEACKEVWEYYPDCEVNDYQSKNIKPWVKDLNDYGSVEGSGGNLFAAGNSSNENYYSVRPHSFFADVNTDEPTYKTLPGYNYAVYENKTFNYFLYDVNTFKSSYLAADDGAVSWWIAHYLYNQENPEAASLTPYYAETIFHMGLLNPVAMMGYVIPQEINDKERYEFCLQIMDEVMQELTRVAGKADREPIVVQPKWNNHYALSGMRVEDKNIWRLTPDTDIVSVENFKVAGADPTFYVNGQTVTFPQGKIIPNGNIHGYDAQYNIVDNHTCGYWIETPSGVTPVETRVENYNVEYPAYEENYDAFDVGTEYTSANALPVACWEVKQVSGYTAAMIANPTDANDKVLALKGNCILKNVKLPKNITAGDSYAEHQAWQVSVTVPADLSAEAEVVLLSAGSDKKKSSDGGFKIAGGKVYYCQNGAYVEMPDVTLSSGKEYTLRRELDFNNKSQLVSSYYVYDNVGALIGKAKNVPMSYIDLPIACIAMSCNKVEGGAVLLDDYKLYPTRVGTDFELYNANHGMKIVDTETPSEVDTAYRYAWMNTTNMEKSYSIIAQYYNGDTVVSEDILKEVKMAPNSEGVELGIVELADKGNAVRIYIKDNNPPEVEEEVNVVRDDEYDAQIDRKLILVAIATLILIIIFIFIRFMSSKHKLARKLRRRLRRWKRKWLKMWMAIKPKRKKKGS